MIHLPGSGSKVSCVVGIDPGSTNLGFAAIEFDIDTLKITRTQAFTLTGTKLMDEDNWDEFRMGQRYSRIQAIRQHILVEFIKLRPLRIAIESPFYSQKRPSAFGVLMEVMEAVRQSVVEYDSWRDLLVVDPPTVKRAVGGSGNAKKEEMQRRVISMTELNYCGEIEKLDEHSIDAIAVAYWCYTNLIKG